MPPVSVFASSPGSQPEEVRRLLRGRWRVPARAVTVLLSLHGLPPAQIAVLLECHPSTVRRWIGRFNAGGTAGPAGSCAGGPGWAGAGYPGGSPRC